jgi:hypothetical protein
MHPEATEQTRDSDQHPTVKPPTPSCAEQWFTFLEGEVFGPLTIAEMRALSVEGRLTPKSQTTRRSPPEWKSAAEDERLAALFSRPDPSVLPSPPAPPAGDLPLLAVRPATRSATDPTVRTLPPANSGKPPSAAGPAATRPTPVAAGTRGDPVGEVAPKISPVAADDRRIEQLLAERDRSGGQNPVFMGLLSLVLPGLGQLICGAFIRGISFGIGAFLLWGTGLGWIVHIWAAIDAARVANRNAEKRQGGRGSNHHTPRRYE